jgi:hypothetical protein
LIIYVKNNITCAELWVDKVYEMRAVEIKVRDPNITWEIVGIYRPPNEDMRLLLNLTDRTGYMGRTTKRSIIGGFLNLPYADWYGHAEKSRWTQICLNRLVWEKGVHSGSK